MGIRPHADGQVEYLERVMRFELTTSCLGSKRSGQLSYTRSLLRILPPPQFPTDGQEGRNQLRDPSGAGLDTCPVKHLHGGGLIQPNPASVPWLQIKLGAEPALDRE